MTKDDKYLWRLCKNIIAGRFNWRGYCSQQSYYGREICVTPLFCSYGQIGYTVNFPYSRMPDVEYDWEVVSMQDGDISAYSWDYNYILKHKKWFVNELTIDEMDYKEYFEQEQG